MASPLLEYDCANEKLSSLGASGFRFKKYSGLGIGAWVHLLDQACVFSGSGRMAMVQLCRSAPLLEQGNIEGARKQFGVARLHLRVTD